MVSERPTVAEPFVVKTPEGEIHGSRSGRGEALAVLLHGGPGLGDLLEPLSELLAGEFTTVRYQQRGLDPTTIREPYTVAANVGDAVAVWDAEVSDRAWLVEFSWGGYLALQVVCAIPERIEGVILIDPLGAYHEAVGEFGDNLIGRVPADLADRFAEIEARSDRGEASQEEQSWLDETIWRCYFAAPDRAPPRPEWRSNGRCFMDTIASVKQLADRQMLITELPRLSPRNPVLFVHAAQGPMPLWSTTKTAALIGHAEVRVIDDTGHFIWYEQPDELHAAITDFVHAAPSAS